MKKTFTHVLSLLSVNGYKIFAGGNHSWVVLDDVMPKKEEFIAGGPASQTKEDGGGGASKMEIGSNWNYQVMN
jgi:hypothetical protein